MCKMAPPKIILRCVQHCVHVFRIIGECNRYDSHYDNIGFVSVRASTGKQHVYSVLNRNASDSSDSSAVSCSRAMHCFLPLPANHSAVASEPIATSASPRARQKCHATTPAAAAVKPLPSSRCPPLPRRPFAKRRTRRATARTTSTRGRSSRARAAAASRATGCPSRSAATARGTRRAPRAVGGGGRARRARAASGWGGGPGR